MADLGGEPVERRREECQAARSSAWRSRCRICVELGAGSSPSRSQAIRSTSGSMAAYWSDRARELPDAHTLERPLQTSAVSIEREGPARELEPERGRLCVDAVRPAHAERVPMLLSAPHDRRKRGVEAREQDAAGLANREGEGGVEHVRGREPVMEPAAVVTQVRGDGVDERSHVVTRFPLSCLGPRWRRSAGGATNCVGTRGRHDADCGPPVQRRELDLEPPLRASPPPTRPWSFPVGCSGRSPPSIVDAAPAGPIRPAYGTLYEICDGDRRGSGASRGSTSPVCICPLPPAYAEGGERSSSCSPWAQA